jgi:hypothetical protein
VSIAASSLQRAVVLTRVSEERIWSLSPSSEADMVGDP